MNRKTELQHMGVPISKFSWNIMIDSDGFPLSYSFIVPLAWGSTNANLALWKILEALLLKFAGIHPLYHSPFPYWSFSKDFETSITETMRICQAKS